jgi:SAM-dependent methyltransferase
MGAIRPLVMPVTAVRAQAGGDLPLADASVDLVTCFNVLHHIPNVSHVLSEFARVLSPGGLLLLREPTTSMGGNWGTRRPGLTPHERGVPPSYLRSKRTSRGFALERASFALFPPVLKLWQLGPAPYNSRILTALDRLLCRLLARWTIRTGVRAWVDTAAETLPGSAGRPLRELPGAPSASPPVAARIENNLRA